MTDKEALKMALEFIERVNKEGWILADFEPQMYEAIAALKERLEDPMREMQRLGQEIEQEPVAIDGNTSDGYHTFNELYEFRKAYNAALFNEWSAGGKCSVHKSWRHHDGELCFGGGWFIVVAILPNGQISNHYEAKDWNLFDVPETECAMFEFDGHTSIDVVARLKAYTTPPQRTWVDLSDEDIEECFTVTPDLYLKRHIAQRISAKLKEKNT